MLPPDIQALLADKSDSLSLTTLQDSVAKFTKFYRGKDSVRIDPIQSDTDALAYALLRMPSTYAVSHEVLSRLSGVSTINKILDIGAGTGAVMRALQEFFPKADIEGIEKNNYMRALARELTNLEIYEASIESFSAPAHYNLVSLSYVLNEIQNYQEIMDKIWSLSTNYLVIIEAGTPRGFEIIATFRDFILRNGGHIIAPCPHEYACPLQAEAHRWCHFEKRVQRSKYHKALKADASRGYEDEPFSYLIAQKSPVIYSGDRLISRVHGSKILSADLCTQAGDFKNIKVSKRDALYKTLRRAIWGDLIE